MKYLHFRKMNAKLRTGRLILLFLFMIIIASSLIYTGERLIKRQNITVGSSLNEKHEGVKNKQQDYKFELMNQDGNVEYRDDIDVKHMSNASIARRNEPVPGPGSPKDNRKVAHLTFDDGPTPGLTPRILDILKQYDIKATFFVIGNVAERSKDLVRREIAEGHEVGNHTYSHVYANIYTNPQNFMNDLLKADEVLKGIIPGYDKKIMRFPGGSFGRTQYVQAVEAAGYRYFDWNSLNGDAEAPKVPADKLIENVKKYSQGKNNITILMHDAPGKETTADSLPKVIEYLKAQGYAFDVIK